mgnify:CR=1 FL=1
MAKILCNYFGLSMAAEGKSDFVGRQAAAFLGYVQQDAERCAANCGSAEDLSAAPEEIPTSTPSRRPTCRPAAKASSLLTGMISS